MSSSALEFIYWSDPLCVWAFVAQPKLEKILEQWGDRVAVEYRVVPVFGSVPWRFESGPWAKAGPEGRVAATQRVAAKNGREDVDGSVWLDDPPASSWASGAAVKAAFAAEAAGEVEPGKAAAYLSGLRHRFFVENGNIAKRDQQLSVAEMLSIPTACIAKRLDDGSAFASLWQDDLAKTEQRVQGSPTYSFDGGRAMLYGNFPFAILHATVEELASGIGLGATAC